MRQRNPVKLFFINAMVEQEFRKAQGKIAKLTGKRPRGNHGTGRDLKGS